MNITERHLRIIHLLLSNQQVTLTDLTYQLNISHKKLKYELEKIRDSFHINYNETYISLESIEQSLKYLSEIHLRDFIFTEHERYNYLMFYLLLKSEYISLEHLMAIANASRNTILQDLKNIRQQISLLNGKLNYNRTDGYSIRMNEEDKDLLFVNLLHLLSEKLSMPYFLEKVSGTQFNEFYYLDLIKKLESEDKLSFSDSHKKLISYSLFIIENRLYKSTNENGKNLLKEPIIELIIKSTTHRNDDEIFIDQSARNLISKFIQNFELYSGTLIYDKDSLSNKLLKHFYPATLRAKYGISSSVSAEQLINEVLQPIFDITKIAIKPLEQELDISFSSNEIALWSLYFAGVVRNQGTKIEKSIIAIVACPNGIAVSHALTHTLRFHFPKIIFLEPTSLSDVHNYEDEVDIIFSTHPLNSKKQVYLISQTLSISEINHLYLKISNKFDTPFSPQYTLNDLITVIRNNADIKNEEKLVKEIKELLNISHQFKEGYQPMLKELLTESFIQTHLESDTWQQSIQLASQPLLENNIVSQNYIDAMIESVVELGPYIVIMPEFALPHARPEDGAKEIGLSFANFKSPVIFPNDKPVKAMIVLSAKDSNTHLKALAEMTEILGDEQQVSILKDTQDKNEILSLINK